MFHNTGITAETSTLPLVVNGAQPVWLTLNEARERAFTGEIVFETDPEVVAYLDHGIVYYAERVSDASLGRRLLDAGVIDKAQLDRGTVRVGDIEHLGRLFDRDPSIDRDAVVVLAETATEALITDLANRVTAGARVTAYRHHPSGVHRWFVAPLEPVAIQRPISAVAQLDSTVVDQLPGLPFSDTDELTIEWDDEFDDEFGNEFEGDRADFEPEFDLSLLEVADRPVDEVEIVHSDELDDDVFELSLDHAEFIDGVDDDDDVVLAFDELFDVETVEHTVDEIALDEIALDEIAVDEITVEEIAVEEFAVDVDVSGDVAVDMDVVVEAPEVAEVPGVSGVVEVPEVVEVADATTVESPSEFDFSVVWPDAPEEPADEEAELAMPPLELSDELDEPAGEVPDEVADAVRRAIAAIESASVASAPAFEVTGQLPQVDDFTIEYGDPAGTSNADIAPVSDAAAPPFSSFAPPAMETRAEVLYGQMTDTGETVEEPGADPADGDSERSSALRRLIGSLRRKDH